MTFTLIMTEEYRRINMDDFGDILKVNIDLKCNTLFDIRKLERHIFSFLEHSYNVVNAERAPLKRYRNDDWLHIGITGGKLVNKLVRC